MKCLTAKRPPAKRRAARVKKSEVAGALENTVHAAIAAFLDTVLIPPTIYTTVPGGDGRMTTVPGYKSGFPDIIVLPSRSLLIRGVPVIGLEVKRSSGGVVSEKQIKMHEALHLNGTRVFVVRSIDDVRLALAECLLPTRERIW